MKICILEARDFNAVSPEKLRKFPVVRENRDVGPGSGNSRSLEDMSNFLRAGDLFAALFREQTRSNFVLPRIVREPDFNRNDGHSAAGNRDLNVIFREPAAGRAHDSIATDSRFLHRAIIEDEETNRARFPGGIMPVPEIKTQPKG